jgi:hypothetical protein
VYVQPVGWANRRRESAQPDLFPGLEIVAVDDEEEGLTLDVP